MRIGFDASVLVRPHPPGVVRSADRLLDTLEARNRIEVVRLVPPEGAQVRRWRQRELPRQVRDAGLLGLHSFTSAFPLRGPGRRVQTIHELPWQHGVRENADFAHRIWATLGPWRADRVHCPSEFVARAVRKRRLPGASKVRAVPWGVRAPFQLRPPTGTIDEVVLERYRLSDDPVLLAPGAVRSKKGLARLLEGLAAWKQSGGAFLQVIVTGEETPDLRRDLALASRLGLGRWVSTLGFLPETDLASLMRLSELVCVLSHSEGFGLPVLEALACGTPVLVPPDSAQAEVAGPGGIPVRTPEEIATALGELLADGRADLSRTCAAHAAAFTWERTAAGIEELWAELA